MSEDTSWSQSKKFGVKSPSTGKSVHADSQYAIVARALERYDRNLENRQFSTPMSGAFSGSRFESSTQLGFEPSHPETFQFERSHCRELVGLLNDCLHLLTADPRIGSAFPNQERLSFLHTTIAFNGPLKDRFFSQATSASESLGMEVG